MASAATSRAVWAAAYKDYYSDYGIYVFTVSVCSSFKYNGATASYNGGFDAYYKRGFLSIWQVSDWSAGHNQAGNSYEAWCHGNFHYGFEIDGVGLILSEYYVSHRVACSPTGYISRNFTMI